MPVSSTFDDVDLMVKVVLPIANLRHALEAQLKDGGTVDMQQFLMGLKAIQCNASMLQGWVEPLCPIDESETGVRKLPDILRDFEASLSPGATRHDVVS